VMTVLEAILSTITFLAALIGIIRTGVLTKRVFSPQIAVQCVILVQMVIMMIYFYALDLYWLHNTFELLKLTTFVAVCYYFSISAEQMRVFPAFLSKSIVIIFFITVYSGVLTVYILSLLVNNGCANIYRLLFGVLQFLFATLFSVVTVLIVKLGARYLKASPTFMERHTRPMASVTIIYCFTSIIYLALRIFLFLETKGEERCSQVLHAQAPFFLWGYISFRMVDLILPNWAVLWYFAMTIGPKKQVTAHYEQPNFTTADYKDDAYNRYTASMQEVISSTDRILGAKYGPYSLPNIATYINDGSDEETEQDSSLVKL